MKRYYIKIIIFIFAILLISGCKKKDLLYGTWVGPIENQIVYQLDSNNSLSGKNDYILECDGFGNYKLTLNEPKVIKGTYTIKDNFVTFMDDTKMIVGQCEFSQAEIDCDNLAFYAIKYIKK